MKKLIILLAIANPANAFYNINSRVDNIGGTDFITDYTKPISNQLINIDPPRNSTDTRTGNYFDLNTFENVQIQYDSRTGIIYNEVRL